MYVEIRPAACQQSARFKLLASGKRLAPHFFDNA